MNVLTDFLRAHPPLAVEIVTWANGTLPLRVSTCLCRQAPPLRYVSSVRALLLRGEDVLAVRDAGGVTHILPGGRREAGESLEQTLRREIREETGWAVARVSVLGFLHYHHLGERPAGYRYPFPDFLHALYVAEAAAAVPGAREADGYEVSAGFAAAGTLRGLGVPEGQLRLLETVTSSKEAWSSQVECRDSVRR